MGSQPPASGSGSGVAGSSGRRRHSGGAAPGKIIRGRRPFELLLRRRAELAARPQQRRATAAAAAAAVRMLDVRACAPAAATGAGMGEGPEVEAGRGKTPRERVEGSDESQGTQRQRLDSTWPALASLLRRDVDCEAEIRSAFGQQTVGGGEGLTCGRERRRGGKGHVRSGVIGKGRMCEGEADHPIGESSEQQEETAQRSICLHRAGAGSSWRCVSCHSGWAPFTHLLLCRFSLPSLLYLAVAVEALAGGNRANAALAWSEGIVPLLVGHFNAALVRALPPTTAFEEPLHLLPSFP